MRIINATKLAIVGLVLAAVMLADGAPARTNGPMEFKFLMRQARDQLGDWNFREADRLSRELLAMAADDDANDDMKAQAHLFRASYHFFAGDYQASYDELTKMSEVPQHSGALPDLHERSRRLSEVWRDKVEVRSEHFIIRHAPGRDAVMVETAIETLEAAHAALTKDLQIDPVDPVLVEIYPTFDGFQAATNLSEEALEKSGTIAVCKYRRLMINTPRSLVRGYNYRDTLSHEYVHWLIYKKYPETIPIWLHEGLAKYEEERWRNDLGGTLSPTQKSLLASALRENELISFDRMSPSFAYLETPRQGQLAFAEVTSVIKYMVETGGWELVFKLCDELSKNDKDYRVAIPKATGKPFETFWNDWIAYARGQGYKEIPGMEITAHEIRKGDENFDSVDDEVDEEDVAESEHWRWVRLGDLLRDRQHYQAALVEYQRARDLAPYSPRILNKIGLCHFLAEQYEQSVEPLKTAMEIYPGQVYTHVNLGRAYFHMKKHDQAEAMFLKALDVNPFNPIPYGYLIKIYEERKDEERAAKFTERLLIITS